MQFQPFGGLDLIALRHFHDEANGAIAQLRVRCVHVDHQVSANFAERDHGAGADNVERNLRRGARFQTG